MLLHAGDRPSPGACNEGLGFHTHRNAGPPVCTGPESPVQPGEGSQSLGEAADRTPLSQQTVPLFCGIVLRLGSPSISLPPLACHLLNKPVWTLVWTSASRHWVQEKDLGSRKCRKPTGLKHLIPTWSDCGAFSVTVLT